MRNVGEDVVASIVRERKAKGLYKDFTDYLEKIDLTACNKRVTESLIKAGAFDSMGYSCKGLMMVFEDAAPHSASIQCTLLPREGCMV